MRTIELLIVSLLLSFSHLSSAQSGWNLLNPSPTINDLKATFFIDQNTGWAVGVYGAIIKTTDGGEKWQALAENTQFNLTDVYFIDQATGWACGMSGEILKTTDGGMDWERVSTNIPEYFIRIYFSTPLDGIAMYIGGFYKTSDGGSTWRRIPGGWIQLNDMHFIDPMNGWAVGGNVLSAIALQTTDGGETWNMKAPSGQVTLWCAYFTSPSNGFAGSESGVIYRTTNAGNTWTSLQTATNLTFNSISFSGQLNGIAVAGIAAGGSELRTTNGGNSWQNVNTGSFSSFYDLAWVNSNNTLLVGVEGNIYKSTDSGVTWLSKNRNQITRNINSIFFIDREKGWIAAQGGNIFKTVDGGLNWMPSFSGGTTHFKQVQFVDELNGYAVGLEWFANRYSMILKTKDGGITWDTVFHRNQIPLYNIHFLNERTGWAVGWYSQIFKTTDGGQTWVDKSLSQWYDFYSVKFYDELTGYAAGYPGLIFKTTDGGNSWQQLSTSTGGYLRHLHIFSPDTVIVVGRYNSSGTAKAAVLKSVDGGANWVNKGENLGSILMSGYFTTTGTGFVSGEGRALFRTTDQGETWTRQFLQHAGDYQTLFFVDPMTGWLGGTDGLLLKTTNGGVTFVNDETPATSGLPKTQTLLRNYPNPFNPSTNIVFDLKSEASVTLTVFSAHGEKVYSEWYERLAKGRNKIKYNAAHLSSGVYLYRVSGYGTSDGEPFTLTGKMMLTK
ncbi:MAG: hypothetical protein HBSAPP04_05180 [Ignavibacteriaceae bacterium]|nr:MAG: T9SS C-terminal target domain-containing protein [Chlorobiota bacterium]GJQ31679.1 MAG: hypothetical protein HBSAPP04_05180 [Ignavibacteriaceae bacterium]